MERPLATPGPPIKMTQISDAHVDRQYMTGANQDCVLPSCCRYDVGMGHGSSYAGYWGVDGRCDIPLRTAL